MAINFGNVLGDENAIFLFRLQQMHRPTDY